MRIAEFIRDTVLLPRLKQQGCLVVYDRQGRYRNLCLEFADERCVVVDASESSLEGRESAMAALLQVGDRQHAVESLLVYVPGKPPVTPEEKQLDPFSVYAVCGGTFPNGDADEFLALCLRAKPDHATEIRNVFQADPEPSFATIDAIGTGTGWPQLKALLRAESARDILLGLLAPQPDQADALGAGAAWIGEAKAFLQGTLGLDLKTKAKKWSAIAEELWRYLLFSEFAFDLPSDLPAALSGVPRAPATARLLVEDLCEQLRHDLRTRPAYLDKAPEIEKELTLTSHCAQIADLGHRDTFPFEERSFLRRAITALEASDLDTARGIMVSRTHSVWTARAEHQAQWAFLKSAFDLIERCEDLSRQLGTHSKSLDELVDFYAVSLREGDRLQRELEQAIPDLIDPYDLLGDVITSARAAHRSLAEKAQAQFIRYLESTGWPLPGRLGNVQVFDRFVAPQLKDSGRKVAYLLIDALRYELGVELEKQLTEDGPVDLHMACASLPSVTLVGMASLLPDAAQALWFKCQDDALVPMLGDFPVRTVTERMDAFRRRFGDRFAETTLADFLKKGADRIPPTTNLLVLRSYDIDSQLENNPDTALALVPQELKRIRAALHKLRKLGYAEAVIATDHGFFLNAHASSGDVCVKPGGNWTFRKDRSMLGAGAGDAHNLLLPAERAGIRGDFAAYICPRSLAPYQSGLSYFHSGASLQELIVPVLVARLSQQTEESIRVVQVELAYRAGTKKITTRLPSIEVSVEEEGLFALGDNVELALEAHDAKGNVVGEAKPGGPVNPASGTIALKPGERVNVTLRMQMEYEGKFTVKAINPSTLAVYASLNLETDYTV
ncbi:PglZ domain-containing protein [Methylolobus aquaticus]